jgi:hypothetical protein
LGGVDSQKYCGNLVTIDLVNPPAYPGAFVIPSSGISGTAANGSPVTFSGTQPQFFLLDSGTTVTLVPEDIYNSIVAYLGVDPTTSSIPCTTPTLESIDFAFPGITIKISIDQYIAGPFDDGTCAFGGLGKGTPLGNVYIIGDPGLSSMYIVYDLDNHQVAIAPAIFDTTNSDIRQITSG